jgi:peptide chain release factor 3
MDVTIFRSGETIRLAKPHSFLGQERQMVEEAWPGDILGLFDPGNLRIGDTLFVGESLNYQGIPRFAPEHFARLRLKDPLRRKHLALGLAQLSQEGAIQLFYRPEMGEQDPYLGAIGMLQFDVLQQRLEIEYNVHSVLEPVNFRVARWIGGSAKGLEWMKARRDYTVVEDRHGQPVALAESPWPLQYAQRENPGLEFFDVEPL